MQTYEEVKKQRDWLERQVTYMESRVDEYAGKLHYETELEVSRAALQQLRVSLTIAEAAVQTHMDERINYVWDR